MQRSAILYVVSILFGLGPHINFIFNGGGENFIQILQYTYVKNCTCLIVLHITMMVTYIQNHGVKEDDNIMWSMHYYQEINFLI